MKLKPQDPTRPGSFLMWFGLIGAGICWALMFVFGYGLNIGACGPYINQRSVPFGTWTLIDLACGAALAILSIVAAIWVFRATTGGSDQRTRDELVGRGSPPPPGRAHFLAIIAMAISPLFLCMILLSGLASFVLTACHQA